ncbi:MAG: hypothetical protein WCS43_10745, partial [Verrucomicrobiota bacterium]
HRQLLGNPSVAHRGVCPQQDGELDLAGVAFFRASKSALLNGNPSKPLPSLRIRNASFSPRSRSTPSARLLLPLPRRGAFSSILNPLRLTILATGVDKGG